MSALIQESPTLNAQFGKAPTPADMLSLIRSFGGTFTRGSEVIGDPTPETLSASTYTDNLGVIRQPRVGYPRPNFVAGVNKGVLIEEARTNNWTHSENFSDSSWIKTRATITANQAIAPDGTMTADLYTATGDDARLDKSSIAGQRVMSWFIKRVGSSDVACTLDFSGLAAKSVTATNQWQRVDNFLDNATGFSGRIRIVNNGDAIYIWGAQLEAGSFPTSYIPTAGTTVTRGAERLSMGGTALSSRYRQDQGTFVVKFKAPPIDKSGTKFQRRILYLNDGNANYNNCIQVGDFNASLFRYNVSFRAGATEIFTSSDITYTAGQNITIAFSFQRNGQISIAVNGTLVQSTAIGATAQNLSILRLFRDHGGTANEVASGETAILNYIPVKLTEAQTVLLSRL